MKPLTQLINELVSGSQENWHIKLRAEWPIIMGDLSHRARLERINGSTVIIGVYDSHWMHELHALSRLMLQRMNNALHTFYPEGFMLTTIRCIWVVKKERKNKNTHVELSRDKSVSRKPSQEALHAVQKLAHKELQEVLLAYYQRCKETV